MKKLLVLLLISALAIFVFAGCDGIIDDGAEGEGEGEGEGEIEEVTVEIEDAVELGGKNWVKAGSHEITVTFPAPVENAMAYVTDCVGGIEKVSPEGPPVPLWPNEDKTVWKGSGTFGKDDGKAGLDCCSSYVLVEAGECAADVCIYYPVVVDSEPPYAKIELCLDDCVCEGCELSFTSTTTSDCEPEEECGDACSGLAGWTISVFDEYPFDDCCEIPCVEPLDSGSGTSCPIDWTTGCLEEFDDDGCEDADTVDEDNEAGVFVVVNLVDNVGNEAQYGAWVGTCDYDTCGTIWFVPFDETSAPDLWEECIEDTGDFVICDDNNDETGLSCDCDDQT
jgi:hypothetical protein